MNIKQWLHAHKCEKERSAMAAAAGTTVQYLWQLSGLHRACNRKMAEAISKATNDEITVVHAMLPDLAELEESGSKDALQESA